MEKWTLDKFRETFFEFETSLNLLNLQIMGVYFWKLIRANVITYTRGKLVNGEVEKKLKVNKTQKKENKHPFLKNPEDSPLLSNGKVDYIILDRGKKNLYNNELVDLFTYDIQQEIIKNNSDYLILDFPFMGQYFLGFDNQRKSIESVFYYFTNQSKIIDVRPTKLEQTYFENIPREFKKRFGFEINEIFHFRNKIIAEIKRFKLEYQYFLKLFIEKRPKKVFTTIYYRRHSAVEAAKNLEITVVDIQYANININHPAYGFPEGTFVPYFPDEIVLWGEFFKDVTPLPNNVLTKISAPSYFKASTQEYSHVQKQKNLVTFASQHSIGERLFEMAYRYAKKNKDMNVIFRLHPGELGKYREYNYFTQSMELSNFKLSTKDTDELHELLAKSEFQVGVYSTTMLEGILHHTKSIFVDINGVEEYKYIYENDYAPLIKNVKELENVIRNYNYKPIEISYFFNFTNPTQLL